MTKNNLKVVKSTKNQELENKEKNKALDAAISQITDTFGKGSVMKLGQQTAMDIESISTGSLSLDLADYFFNDKAFERVLIFEGGWPEWKEAQYPSELSSQHLNFTENKNISKDQTLNIKNPENIIFWITIMCGLFVLMHFLSNNGKIFLLKGFFDKIDISLLPRILLGIIFIYASYYKIIDPISFSKNIHNYHLVPIWTENLAALIIPWLELIIGINLIFGVFIESEIFY